MELLTTGFIIRTEHYSACVDFYQRVLGLPIVEEKHDGDFHMTHFAFGGAYLLIETGGTADPVGNGPIWKRKILRLDVADYQPVIAQLESMDVRADYYAYDWGNVVITFDPDGNQVEFKSPA
ncbi:glyoxalase family protein [Photobacterium aphoticum]|uniref:Glyoxalase family protein n=1 Tax=Photobacterium aphoticum TaxID=754436 RepID=A0A090QLN7_9GAMM|nr:glyoxalase family protein [Photobacterium aphoticum]